MLGRLAGVTVVTPDLDRAVSAYGEFLGYCADRVETVSPDLAALWSADRAAGARMAVLRPEGGEDSFIRLVESDGPAGYHPLSSFGWNAAEIVVRDLDALAARLAGSPFQIIGPPETLDFDFTDKIRAMQVVGPGREVLYLTEIEGDIPGFDLPKPVGAVGQVFVAVLGGRSVADLADGLSRSFGLEPGPVFQAKIAVLSQAHGLPLTTRHPLSTIGLAGRTLIELDAYPATAIDRPLSDAGLPMGIAMASFDAVGETGGRGPKVVAGPDNTLFELLSDADSNNKNL